MDQSNNLISKVENPHSAAAIGVSRAEKGSRVPKHRVVLDYLFSNIESGVYKPGDRLPSEAELGSMFNASRITVAKAVLELQRRNLVSRRPGAGTHVQAKPQAVGHSLGLLIPDLGRTEIFEPICHGMMRSPFSRPDTLLWGNASGFAGTTDADVKADEAEQMAEYFIAQKVSGVFFAPLEFIEDRDSVNRRIMRRLERSRIPTILLDRCYLAYPDRSAHDLIGIDNRRTGYLATEHLLKLGATRLVFLSELNSASTVDARITGFFEALRAHGICPLAESAWKGPAADVSFIRRLLDATNPEAIVCANDTTAARLMQSLIALDRRIPDEIRVTGVDDVPYASLLPVPLTTMRQNCTSLGVMAMATMLDRLAHPDLPVRDVLLPTRLVVRKSCGSRMN